MGKYCVFIIINIILFWSNIIPKELSEETGQIKKDKQLSWPKEWENLVSFQQSQNSIYIPWNKHR